MPRFLLVRLMFLMTAYILTDASFNHRWSFFSLTKTCFHDYGHSLALYENTNNIFRCCERCMEQPLCAAILFDANTKRCLTNTLPAMLENLPADCGTKYVEIIQQSESVHTLGWNFTCTTTADCGLIHGTCGANGRCVCQLGYSYNFTVQQCAVNCTVYGDTFEMYRGMAIMGHNDQYLTLTNAEQCRSACLNATSFTCRSFEHTDDDNCRLSSKTKVDVPTTYVEEDNTNFYQRNCAEI